MEAPQVGSVVRCISTNGVDPARSFYAIVVSVAPPHDELTGANGEPALGLVSLDPAVASKPNKLGSAEWHTDFKRESGVLHNSHPDVIDGKVSTFWVDALPALPDVDVDDLKEHLDYQRGKLAPAQPESITTPEGDTLPPKPLDVEPVAPVEEPAATEPVAVEPEEATEPEEPEEAQETHSEEEHAQA